MQEAYAGGYRGQMVRSIRSMFNATFKTNPCPGRTFLTGITRISKESIRTSLHSTQSVSECKSMETVVPTPTADSTLILCDSFSAVRRHR